MPNVHANFSAILVTLSIGIRSHQNLDIDVIIKCFKMNKRFLTIVLLISSLSFALSQESKPYGASKNPGGEPLGGGDGYSAIVKPSNSKSRSSFLSEYTVSNKSEFLQALGQAGSNDLIYLSPGSTIDLSGSSDLQINSGVTISGNRGEGGAPGPLIKADHMPNGKYLFSAKAGVRITGIRIQGPDVDNSDITYPISPFPPSPNVQSSVKAIALRGDNIEVDNCEISNFHRAGVDCQSGRGLKIHHN